MLDEINDLLTCLIDKTQTGKLAWFFNYSGTIDYFSEYTGIFKDESETYELYRFKDNKENVTLSIKLDNKTIEISTLNIPITEIRDKLFKLFLIVYWADVKDTHDISRKLDELILKL